MPLINRNIPKIQVNTTEVSLQKPFKKVLENGLTLLLVENHKLPRISTFLSIDNPIFSNGDKVGLEAICAGVFGSDTLHRSKKDFYEEMEQMGSSIKFSESSITLHCLSKYFDQSIALFEEALLAPKFTETIFEAEKKNYLSNLKAMENNTSAIAQKIERMLAFGREHPYGEFATEESVASITLEDVENYYNTYFKPNNAFVVITGDFKTEDILEDISILFSKWEKGTIPSFKSKEISKPSKSTLCFVDMPNASQSSVALLNSTTLKLEDPDYFASILANSILGGDFSSYLNQNLREDKGWTYGARSGLIANKYVSMFRTKLATRNELADKAILEILKEIEKIKKQHVEETHLQLVKANYTGRFIRTMEDANTIASFALNTCKNKLPVDFYDQYIQKIQSCSAEEIQNAAQKHFSSKANYIVVVGNGSILRKPLKNLGFVFKEFTKEGVEI